MKLLELKQSSLMTNAQQTFVFLELKLQSMVSLVMNQKLVLTVPCLKSLITCFLVWLKSNNSVKNIKNLILRILLVHILIRILLIELQTSNSSWVSQQEKILKLRMEDLLLNFEWNEQHFDFTLIFVIHQKQQEKNLLKK